MYKDMYGYVCKDGYVQSQKFKVAKVYCNQHYQHLKHVAKSDVHFMLLKY